MTGELTKLHYVAILLTSFVFILIVILLSKLVRKKIVNSKYQQKISLNKKNLLSHNEAITKVKSVPVLPEFPYNKLTLVAEEYIQPPVFSDKTEVFDDCESDSPDTYGTTNLKVRYELTRSMLIVTILKGNYTVVPEDTENHYITTTLFPQKDSSHQTCVHKTPNPIFNETFEFQVPLEYLLLQSLKFSLWSFDRFSHHEIIADGLLQLSQLERYGLSISREIGVTQKLRLVTKASGTCGEIFLSLGYLGLAEKLAVIVIEVINLPKIKNEPPDPYVEVTLRRGNQKLKTKRTTTKFKKQSSTYNETLTFDVEAEFLHEISLSFSVQSEDKSSNLTELLGNVFLGPEASGENFEHWDNIRTGSKPTARWHKLQKS